MKTFWRHNSLSIVFVLLFIMALAGQFYMGFNEHNKESSYPLLIVRMEDLIFHATFRIYGTDFMASDVGYMVADSAAVFAGFSLLLRLDSTDRARRVFDALADSGRVLIPLAKSAFTSWYGIVIDRFGISWKITVDENGG